MAVEILLPRLGWDMTEGAFGEWLKLDGDIIKPGDLLYTVEGDKATQEVESLDAGILHIRPDGPQTGDVIEVGTLLAYIAEEGEAVTFNTESMAGVPAESATSPAPRLERGGLRQPSEHTAGTTQHARRNGKTSSPRARRVAAELNIDWTQLTGSGRSGRIIEKDVRAAASLTQEAPPLPIVHAAINVTPVAARMAAEAGIDLGEIASRKSAKRIQRRDVEAAIAARRDTAEDSKAEAAETRLPITHIRQLIAQRMSQSAQLAASVTLTTEADASELVAMRQQFKVSYAPRGLAVPSYNDLFIKLCAVALQEYSLLNAVWGEEEIIVHQAVHIGLAVDADDGLFVPVVKNAHSKSLRQIAAETSSLIGQVQTGEIRSSSLQSGTFTITNLGVHNIDAFTPIINLPQCAILGIGRIVQRPAVYDGQVVPRHMVALSLTFDHRVIDGGPAAQGLDRIREYVEAPLLWLID